MGKYELDSRTIKKLDEYVAKHCDFIEKTHQIVSDDGSEVTLIATVTLPDISLIERDIKAFEEILDAKYVSFISLPGSTQLVFRFNK